MIVHFQIEGGSQSGSQFDSSNFPLQIGRAADAALRLEDPGVWDHHFSIQWENNELILTRSSDGLVMVNGVAVDQKPLRNGDVIALGSVKIYFSFGPTRQLSLRMREFLTWVSIGILCAAQVGLIYWLSQ